MTRAATRKKTDTRRFLAIFLLVAFLVFQIPSMWISGAAMAAEPVPEKNGKVYHDNEYFELYHRTGGEVAPKILEYLFAETVTPGQTRPVYCVMAGAPTPETGSIVPAAMDDPAAASLLGKIQYIIDMEDASFELPDTVNSHPHIHYYVKQILIWHLIHLYRSSLGSSVQTYFKGIDIDTFIDGEGSGPTAKKILSEAKRLWKIYDAAGRPSLSGAYTPNYRAEIGDMSSSAFDPSSGKYRATFTVKVRETNKGTTGGTFRFTEISGGRLYMRGSDGKYTIQTTTNAVLPSGSAFAIEGSWKDMASVSSGKALKVQVKAVSNTGNEAPQRMYGYFFDSSLTASGKTRQTYVGWHESSSKKFSGTEGTWETPVAGVNLNKVSSFGDITVPEKGAEFEIFRSEYGSFEKARADGFGFYGISAEDGKILDKETGRNFSLPSGTYTIRQTVVPEGTKAMTPNPGAFTVDVKKTKNEAVFEDEIKAGAFAIEKKIRTGYDEYKGTDFKDLEPEADAVFQVWNTGYDSYEKAPAAYRDLLTTDERGYAKTKVLPYGEYRVHQIESESTKYTHVCEDQTVKISGSSGGTGSEGEPETTLSLINRRYELKIQIRKVDERTGEVIPAAGVEFQIKDERGNVQKDWDGNDVFVTGPDGTCDMRKLGLPVGTYYLYEKSAPAGFILAEEPVPIEVKKDESFIGVGPDGDMKAVPFADQEVPVTLELLKTGEMLTSSEKTDTGYQGMTGYRFIYTQQALKDAVFELYCSEDVLGFERDISLLDPAVYPEGAVRRSDDGKTFAPYKMFDKDGDGVRETPLKKGTLLGTYTTGADGKIEVSGLSLDAGSASAVYAFVEVSAPEGFVLDSSPIVFEARDDREDRTSLEIRVSQTIRNERKKTEIDLQKKGREYVYDEGSSAFITVEKELAGAVFGIYAGEPVLSASGEVLAGKNDLIEVLISDENGHCRGTVDFPGNGTFYARELQAPEGFVLSNEIYACPVIDPIVNESRMSEIRIGKVCGDGTKTPMDDVTFALWMKGEEGKEDLLISEGKTDKDGKLSFLVGPGEYYLVETSVGHWTSFMVMDEPVPVVCGKEGKVMEYQLEDGLTKTVAEKRSATNGGLLGNCGISVKNKEGQVLSFLWNEAMSGYVLSEAGGKEATTVLYTCDDKESPDLGKVYIYGLPAGDYEIFEVEAPKGYRNDSEVMPVTVRNEAVLGVTRLYDTMKTGEEARYTGYGASGICGITAVALLAIGYIEIREKYRRKRRK